MSDTLALYQEILLDHNNAPRNYGTLPNANRHAEGYNPLCGDRVTVSAFVEDGRVVDLRFEGAGCAISTASASLMTEAVKGKTVAEAEALFRDVVGMLTASEGAPPDPATMGKLVVIAGVREYPMRVKCATLAWHALHEALTVSTEEAAV